LRDRFVRLDGITLIANSDDKVCLFSKQNVFGSSRRHRELNYDLVADFDSGEVRYGQWEFQTGRTGVSDIPASVEQKQENK
jgi:hypothetical protein